MSPDQWAGLLESAVAGIFVSGARRKVARGRSAAGCVPVSRTATMVPQARLACRWGAPVLVIRNSSFTTRVVGYFDKAPEPSWNRGLSARLDPPKALIAKQRNQSIAEGVSPRQVIVIT